jgi:hypothetical protein
VCQERGQRSDTRDRVEMSRLPWQDSLPLWALLRKSRYLFEIFIFGSNLHLTCSLGGGDGWVADLFFEEDIAVISSGRLTGVVGVGHDGYA